MSTFPDGLFQYGGVPVGAGTLFWPRSNARVYFVDGLNGNDGFDGLSMDSPFDTIARAVTVMNARISWSATPWAVGDILVISPGVYAENLTSLPYGCTIVGLGDSFDLDGQRGVTINPATGSAVDVTSCINSRIHNICFSATAGTSALFQADNFNRNVITNCVFAGIPGASPTTTRGLETVKDMTGNLISGCKWLVCRNSIYVVTDNANSKQASGNIIENFYISGGDQTGIHFNANCLPVMTQVNNGVINGGGTTLALGIDDDSDKVHFSNVYVEATANDPASGAGLYNNCYLNGALIT